MNVLITICARGGSKGIPKKNIKLLNNKPLIQYTYDIAKELKNRFENVIIELSTDDLEIKTVASDLGFSTNYVRPNFLATDEVGKLDAIKDLLNYAENYYNLKFEYVLDLDVSSPLRSISDILNAFKLMKNDRDALTLFSVNQSIKNPYFNMVEENEEGYYQLSKKLDETILSRQTSPKVYDLNASFYIMRRSFFDLGLKGVITDKSLIFLMDHICFDLDHLIDFEFMEYLIKNNKLDFSLI